jgi:hypothetical protein
MEPITLRSRDYGQGAAETFTDYPIALAKQRPLTMAEQAQSGLAVDNLPGCNWQIWREHLEAAGAPAPKVGDLIVQGLRTWLVWLAENKLFGNVWTLRCRVRP